MNLKKKLGNDVYANDCPENYFCPTPAMSFSCPITHYCPRRSTSLLYNYSIGDVFDTVNRVMIRCPAGYICPNGIHHIYIHMK